VKIRTQQIDGEYWFTAKYAAELLGTTRKTVESMAVREIVRAREEGTSFLIAESDVTRFRRDADLLAEAKKAAKMPAHPRKGETMPAGTIYTDDPPKRPRKVAPRIGNPLADEGHG
jgi:hypothetical protein